MCLDGERLDDVCSVQTILKKFKEWQMNYDPSKHHRRSIRLKEYNYTQPGEYFITLVAYKRSYLFGKITNGTMNLNDFGNIAQSCCHEIPNHFSNARLDEFVVMPNHIHGIIIISDNSPNNASRRNACVAQTQNPKPISGSLGTIVGSYKSAISKRIDELRGMPGGKVWHRNYYEHIVRNEYSLNRIRQYIISNPNNWKEDKENR
jgi:REP element-mobilizing transposase RayT